MKRINIKDNDKKSKVRKSYFLFALIISLLGTPLYLYITDKTATTQAVKSVISINNRKIVYDTYDIYLDNIGPYYSNEFINSLSAIQYQDKRRFNFVDNIENADIVIKQGESDEPLHTQYLLPVGHFYWLEDSIFSEDLLNGEYEILLEEEAYSNFSSILKQNYKGVEIREVSSLLEELKDKDCNCVGMVIPEDIRKEYKLLKYDNRYYLDTFDAGIKISLVLEKQNEEIPLDFVKNIITTNIELELSDFREDTVAKVNMTGVTAMGRRVIEAMNDRNDYDYPAEKIGGFLSDADLTHTSNEVSFVDGCSVYTGLRFCSRPEAIATLKAIGVDLIELTGNHNNDFGSTNNTKTIELYKSEGIEYFGGGLNSEDASKPYITEIDGNKIGFLGYNYYDAIVTRGTNALAGSNKAGANPYSESKMKSDIESIRDEVDVIIVDLQFQECYSYPPGDVIYPICYKPISNQTSTFRKAIDFGADIVIGTQAHQPQTYELYKDGVIFYGLGNLFFDQSMWIGTRQGMILTHYFKDGQLIQTKITPTIYDSSLQVEAANKEEGRLLLELLEIARNSL
jgi:poly-gamma-glutamate capsule biosynthesis protein CapA/YwtB (metallophosphatase superfamily)